MIIPQYHVYKGRITNLPFSTFETLYIGFDKETAENVYNANKNDNRVSIETTLFAIKLIKL